MVDKKEDLAVDLELAQKKANRLRLALGAIILTNICLAVGIFLNSSRDDVSPQRNDISQVSENDQIKPVDLEKNQNTNSVDELSEEKKISLTEEQRKLLSKLMRGQQIKKARAQEKRAKMIVHKESILDFAKKSKMMPMVPSGYFAEPVKSPHPEVNVIRAINREKQIEINTIHSNIPLSIDALEVGAAKYINQDVYDFEPFNDLKLEHPGFKKLQAYIIDDENPVVAAVGLANNGSMVVVTVHGDGDNIRESQDKLKEEFKRIQFAKKN